MKLHLLILTFFATTIVFSQSPNKCASDSITNLMLENAQYASQHELIQQLFTENLANSAHTKAIYIIPVAIHFPAGSEANRACLELLAQNQIDILNADFNATNSDISNWTSASTHYPGVNTGFIDVMFLIASKNHPAGTDPDLVEGGPAVTIGYNYGGGTSSDANWAGYLNFVIKNIGGGLLGFSPLGGLPTNGDAIVMNTNAFGSLSCPGYVPQSPYNLGRTVTHELGHFFNLKHTWGAGSCGTDDGITDTPNIDNPSYGSPAAGSVIMCGNKSLTMNFMDYVNDASMYMFTDGQSTKSTTYISTIYNQFNQAVLALENIEFEKDFIVYPNPISKSELLTIDFKKTDAEYIVEITDLSGKVLLHEKFSKTNSKIELSIDQLIHGMYIVQIYGKNNRASKKLIVQ